MTFQVRELADADRRAAIARWKERWGWTRVVSRGQIWDAAELPGFVAEEAGEIVGLLSYRPDGEGCEVVTLDSFVEDQGIGSALLEAAAARARELGHSHLWLITTNDNIRAIRFYQKRGWDMAALHHHALEASRKLKPEIPLLGDEDIPLAHEIEFRLAL